MGDWGFVWGSVLTCIHYSIGCVALKLLVKNRTHSRSHASGWSKRCRPAARVCPSCSVAAVTGNRGIDTNTHAWTSLNAHTCSWQKEEKRTIVAWSPPPSDWIPPFNSRRRKNDLSLASLFLSHTLKSLRGAHPSLLLPKPVGYSSYNQFPLYALFTRCLTGSVESMKHL